MIEKIKALKKFVNSIPATELDEYKLLQERSKSYNEAIDDVVKLFAIPAVSGSYLEYEVDFNGHCKAKVKVENNEIKVIAAMNGGGEPISLGAVNVVKI